MNYLSVEGISKNYGEKILFENISFGVEKGQKLALVARNGTGKTSLLNCLTGKDTPATGSIVFRNSITTGYLEQLEDFDPELTIMETVFKTENKALNLVKNYEKALEANDNPQEIERLFEEISELDAWNTENNIREILSKLNLAHIEQKVGLLSGGQRRRLSLAKVLIENPDLLILDEPTNHLDLDMIEWLEGYLKSGGLSLIMVTHDRYFLERICDEILELDGGNLYKYKGNYSYYLEKRDERLANTQANIDKAKNLFRKELEWMRRQPKARGTKAKSRIDAFYDTKEVAHQKLDDSKLEINVKMERLGTKILELHNISKRYGKKVILDKYNYTFKRGEKVGLVGANGAGKSTLLNLITGQAELDSGKIVLGETVVIGYYNQEGMKFQDDQRVIEVIREIGEYLPMAGGKKLTAAGLLEKFLFPSHMHFQYVSKLSGGEKKRLYLLTILMQNPNFLILDEPTNDLDIFTLQVLEDYLAEFSGCVIIVTHDRYFMDKVVDHLLVLKGDGTMADIIGNYAAFRLHKKEEESAERLLEKEAKEIKLIKKQEVKRKLSYNEKLEFEKLELEIEKLENRKAELSDSLNNPNLPFEEMTEISEALTKLVKDLDKKSERWLFLADFA